jgi:hypothetical protein
VPTPLLVHGASNLSWSAFLQEEHAQSIETLVEMLPRRRA